VIIPDNFDCGALGGFQAIIPTGRSGEWMTDILVQDTGGSLNRKVENRQPFDEKRFLAPTTLKSSKATV
jgi:hypothetical protein